MTYYNTTHATGRKLADYRGKAATQETRILSYFRRHWNVMRSPSQIQSELGMLDVPITSIRRAMTNLTSDGLLEKTDHQVDGLYGRPEYCWQMAKGQGSLFDENP